MTQIYGIDVSRYQGEIDWAGVATSEIRFAMIRAGYSGSRGGVTVDARFHRNAQGALEAGLPIGLYVYSYDETPEAARASARGLLKLAEGYRVEYPLVLDFEDAIYGEKTRDENTSIARAFLEEIEAGGYYAMLYSYTWFLDNNLDMSDLRQFDVWVADYRETLGYRGDVGMWQYSSKGCVIGFDGNVDLDVAYRDYPQRIREAGLNHLQPAPSETWMLEIYSFREQARAQEVAAAFRTLGFYCEVRPMGEAWKILMFTFQERARAEEVSAAVRTLGFYNEVKPTQV